MIVVKDSTHFYGYLYLCYASLHSNNSARVQGASRFPVYGLYCGAVSTPGTHRACHTPVIRRENLPCVYNWYLEEHCSGMASFSRNSQVPIVTQVQLVVDNFECTVFMYCSVIKIQIHNFY